MKLQWAALVACVGLLTVSGQAAAQTTQRFETSITVMGHAGAEGLGLSEQLLTFSAPVQIPGVSLAPGAYIFRVVGASAASGAVSWPAVIQVTSGDRAHAYAMFFANPASRSKMTDNHEMILKKIRDDAPVRIAAWYLPGSSTGFEPVYLDSSRASERMLAMR
jgi:hypothetical protein